MRRLSSRKVVDSIDYVFSYLGFLHNIFDSALDTMSCSFLNSGRHYHSVFLGMAFPTVLIKGADGRRNLSLMGFGIFINVSLIACCFCRHDSRPISFRETFPGIVQLLEVLDHDEGDHVPRANSFLSLTKADFQLGQIFTLSFILLGNSSALRKGKLWISSYLLSIFPHIFLNSGKSQLCPDKGGIFILAKSIPRLGFIVELMYGEGGGGSDINLVYHHLVQEGERK